MEKDNLVSIAQKSGYSISTISRVLNGKAEKYRISKQAAKKIMEVVKENNYTPNILAKALRTKTTSTIGLLIPNIENAFFSTLGATIIREARQNGYKVIVVDTQEDEENEREGLSALLARNVDGIITVPCGTKADIFINAQNVGVPIVIIDRYLPQAESIPYITTDNYAGAKMATDHLIECGHTNILCIEGTRHTMPVKDRVRGFCDSLKEHNILTAPRITGDGFSIQNGYIETKLALCQPNRPTAIFALSNLIMLGAIKAIRESGLSVPKDISLICFDDNILFNYLDPAITCIAQPTAEIATLAISILLRSISSSQTIPTSQIYLRPTLIARNSVKRL